MKFTIKNVTVYAGQSNCAKKWGFRFNGFRNYYLIKGHKFPKANGGQFVHLSINLFNGKFKVLITSSQSFGEPVKRRKEWCR